MDKTNIEHILALLKKGDDAMLETIYKENRVPFINFAKKYKLPESDVIDVYQDVIIAFRDNVVIGKIQSLNSSIRTYLFSIGKFMMYKKLKTNKLTNALDEDLLNQKQEINFFDYNNHTVDPRQELVNHCFGQLGEKCQKVLKLFYYDGLTLEEIRHYLGYENYNVVKSQKSRCLRTLKEMLEKLNHG